VRANRTRSRATNEPNLLIPASISVVVARPGRSRIFPRLRPVASCVVKVGDPFNEQWTQFASNRLFMFATRRDVDSEWSRFHRVMNA